MRINGRILSIPISRQLRTDWLKTLDFVDAKMWLASGLRRRRPRRILIPYPRAPCKPTLLSNGFSLVAVVAERLMITSVPESFRRQRRRYDMVRHSCRHIAVTMHACRI